jgi:hypothetical protein
MSQHFIELIIERSPEDLEADRQVAAFLAYAAKRDPAFAQYDRKQGSLSAMRRWRMAIWRAPSFMRRSTRGGLVG